MSNQYLENNYKIKLIKLSSDIDYIDSVKIYAKVTPSDIRTNTNELTYWLENKTVEFESYFFSLPKRYKYWLSNVYILKVH